VAPLIDLASPKTRVDRITVVDHVVMGPNTDAYSWKFPTPPDAPWLEPLTVLAAMAAVTTRIRLATGILIAPLRPAVLLAKQAATLDVLSQGRLDLGVGTGWQREEYDAEALDFARRGQLLTDTIAACKALWRDSPAALDTPTLSFRDVYCDPKPVQPGGVPLWIGGAAQAQPRSTRAPRRRGSPSWASPFRHRGGAEEAAAVASRRADPDLLQVQAPLDGRAWRRRPARRRAAWSRSAS
jgi:probable F420-dependent oxidoreductase